jgi:peroxiredoxin/mono/diheme cytochrome c family protein
MAQTPYPSAFGQTSVTLLPRLILSSLFVYNGANLIMKYKQFTLFLCAISGLFLSPFHAVSDEKPIQTFSLQDLEGKDWSLENQKSKAIVIVFLSCECPMSYLKPLSDWAVQYQDKGVSFIGINANPEETIEQIAKHLKEFDIRFPVLKDREMVAVKSLGAKVNPEAFVLDEKFMVRYRGRIDDAYSGRLKQNYRVTKNDLVDAIEAVLSGKEVKVKSTTAFGCPLPGMEKKEAKATSTVTYYKDVLPILQNHCQSCHRPGNVGPFSLLTYSQAVKWSDSLVEEVKAKRMPPWKAEANEFLGHGRSMSEKEIALLQNWVDQGMAKGNEADAPAPIKFSEGWSLGKPDLILEADDDVIVGANGRDTFHCLVFPTNFTEDRHIAAIEVQPGNPKVVHHTIQVIDSYGRARRLQESYQKKLTPESKDRGPGYSVSMGMGFIPNPANGLGGWAPGLVPQRLPDGLGYKLPKGSDIVVQIHYHRTGKVEKDRTRLGIYFAKGEVKNHFQGIAVPGFFFRIPSGEKNFKIDQKYHVDEDLTAYWLVPHMHLLGKDIELLMTRPGEKETSLIQIKQWDYNWQEMYQLKEPIKLPKGTTLRIKATFDNSADNPLNPSSPPKNVRIGEQTTDEMCFVFVGVEAQSPSWRKLSLLVSK